MKVTRTYNAKISYYIPSQQKSFQNITPHTLVSAARISRFDALAEFQTRTAKPETKQYTLPFKNAIGSCHIHSCILSGTGDGLPSFCSIRLVLSGPSE
jgi:hypothetical protein